MVVVLAAKLDEARLSDVGAVHDFVHGNPLRNGNSSVAFVGVAVVVDNIILGVLFLVKVFVISLVTVGNLVRVLGNNILIKLNKVVVNVLLFSDLCHDCSPS